MPQRPNPKASEQNPERFATVTQGSAFAKRSEKPWMVGLVCFLLAAAIWLVFGQTLRHEFVNYDTDIYVYENSHITAGLSLKGIVWAFTHIYVDQWCPLTAISHMADCELYGVSYAGGHHLTNVLLHVATVIFLFLVLRNMTGAFWRSAFVAAVFAIHPLRVESVAWVAERKDVLSGMFFVLTLWAYGRYVQLKTTVSRGDATGSGFRSRPSRFYWWAVAFFAFGLLSKAMLVTVPFVLLLLDWWPLQRFSGIKTATSARSLLMEKIPFFLLAAGCAVVTVFTDKGLNPLDQLALPWRIGNAVVACTIYLKQMFYPVNLAVFYPHPESTLSLGLAGVSATVLLVITAVVIVARKTRPYLFTGWFWYLGMLVPVIGLMQVGSQAHADRYTYLPQIGLYLLLIWTAVDIFDRWRFGRAFFVTASVLILVALGLRAHDQTTHWRDSIALWQHTLASTSGNYLAHNNLGTMLSFQGKHEQAITHYEEALRIKPSYAEAHYNLAATLGSLQKPVEAIQHYQEALRLKPNYADAMVNLGNALSAQGKVDEAIELYRGAIQVREHHPVAHYNLGNAFTKQKKFTEAIHHYERAIQLDPRYAEAHYNLANRLAVQGKVDEAIKHYRAAIEINPGYAEAHNNLGNRLAQKKRWQEAVPCFQRALDLKPDYVEAHNNFGVTLAALGRLDAAISHYQDALELKPDYAEARANLGNALLLQKKPNEAFEQMHEALSIATAQTNSALASAILKRIEMMQGSPPEQPAP